jgi:hypothetical protein
MTMTNLHFLLEDCCSQLRLSLDANVNQGRYKRKTPWLHEFFSDTSQWHGVSKITWPQEIKLKETDDAKDDFENTKTLYSALEQLTPTQAADGRVWDYLSHVTFWSYMRARWGKETTDLKSRYLLGAKASPRTLVRHGISRLWWFGYVSHDDTRSDPFELTAMVLEKQDIQSSILERSYSLNRTVTKALLEVLVRESREEGLLGALPKQKQRDAIRAVSKRLLRTGGVMILDVLAPDELDTYITNALEQISATFKP